MVRLQNISYDEYVRKYSDYRVILIGAGGTFRNFIQFHQDKYFLLNNIDYILDNDKKIEGNEVQILDRHIKIRYLPAFSEKIAVERYVVFILVADKYVVDVAEQLDGMDLFENMPCIYGIGTFRWGYSYFPSPKYRAEIDTESCDNEIIPRIIHYCWFGEKDIPQKDIRCIESFGKYHPDYQIIKWSEKNFDIENAPRYVRDAYKRKKYAFVSDYVRLWAVYEHGGIYLDTDVELFGKLDFILKYRMTFAYMEYGELATGLGFAAEKGAQELKEMLDMYENIPFVYDDGTLNLTPCPRYTNEYFRHKGFYLDNSLDVVDDILFLSSDYLCPLTPVECEDGSYQLAQLTLTDRTVGIHWCNNSWKDPDEIGIFEREKSLREKINSRLFADWKRTRG